MIEKRVKVLLAELILLTLFLNILLIGLETDSSIANVTSDFECTVETEEISQLNSRGGPFIIDLNTETDRPHHNITIHSTTFEEAAGTTIASGDINGDGLEDIIIGVNNLYSQTGKIYIVYGEAVPSPVIDLNNADVVFQGKDSYDWLGFEAIETGDVNGDGFDDVIIGVLGGDGSSNSKSNCGEIYIIYGNNSLPSTWRFSTTPANVTLYGVDLYDKVGDSIATGDINNDGFEDVIVSATLGDGPNNTRFVSQIYGCGEVYVVYGNNSLKSSMNLGNSANITIYGAEGADKLGAAVAAGDINSDGFDDIVVTAPYADGINNMKTSSGEVYVIFGNESHLLSKTIDLLNDSANITIYGEGYSASGNLFGTEVTFGDLNGDNIDDLIVNSYLRVYVLLGNKSLSNNSVINASEMDLFIHDPDEGVIGGYLDTGDINNDGYDDLVVGGYSTLSGGIRYGAGGAYIFNGSEQLPSEINLSSTSTNPDITIYGADASTSGADYPDGAGADVLLTDINGDKNDDIILGVPGGNGRNNDIQDCGEVNIILSGGKLKTLPFVDTIKLKNGDGSDEKSCYAKYKPYEFELRVITPNDENELKEVLLNLNYESIGHTIGYKWMRSSGNFVEVLDTQNYGELDISSNYFSYKKFWTVNFNIFFNWSYPNNELHQIQVKTTSSTGLIDWLNLTTPSFRVETNLNLQGNINATGESQSQLSKFSWIHGGEQIIWNGFKVIYDGTTDFYPPSDSGVTISIQDSTGKSWVDNSVQGEEIVMTTTAGNNTKKYETYYINITGVPETCDKSNAFYQLRIDADSVVFSDFLPEYNYWQNTLRPDCRLYISDPSTNVNSSSVQYRISTDNGSFWENWTDLGIQFEQSGSDYKCSVDPIFKNGENNLIQWRAKDTIGNPITNSEEYRIKIDTVNVSFENPLPLSTTLQLNKTVNCSIFVTDYLSGVNASSIEFSTSTEGIWGYGSWQSAGKTIDAKSINCTVSPIFKEGAENYIRWRAKDVADNDYHVSDNYQIKVKVNHPPNTTLISPLNNSIVYTLTPELTWFGLDPDYDVDLKYDIYLSTEKGNVISLNDSVKIKSNINTSKYKLESPLTDGLSYYWMVIPNDGALIGNCLSGYWTFWVDTTIEIPLVLLSDPKNNTNVTTTTPKLSWFLNYLNSSIITYNIYLVKSPYTSNLISKRNLIQEDYKLTSFIFEKPLVRGEIYHWTVIPIADHPAGKIEGICTSGIWSFKVELPIEHNYNLSLELESEVLRLKQDGYIITNITITNLGDIEDSIIIEIDKGILNANIDIKDSTNRISLLPTEQKRLTLEIIISPIATPKNYTIYITASSEKAPEGQDVSITKTIKLEILEKEVEDEKDKEPRKEFGVWDLIIWLVIILTIFVLITYSIFYYKAKKAREIPTVRAELMTKPPDHLALPGGEIEGGEEPMLPVVEEGAVPTLGAPRTPVQYQLPKAVLTKKQELKLLREKFLLGEIDKDTYKEMKAEIESSDDITDMESEEVELKGKLPGETDGDTLSMVDAVEDVKNIEHIEDIEELEKEDLIAEDDDIEKIESEFLEKELDEELPEIESAIDREEDISEETFSFPDDGLCITCGQSLDQDMAYCWSCGTKYEVTKK